jgi:DNA-binding GntR family transcriptional regulator
MASRSVSRRKAAAPSLGEGIYARLKRDIVSCVFAPGESCSESQLAEHYGVSKAPVRWALAALSREHLVIARPRQGYTVAPLTISSINEMFDVRMIVEPATARMAAGRADIALLKEIQARIAQRWKAGDRRSERRWIEANIAFHIEIARAAGNERLARIATALLEDSQRIMHLLTFKFEGVKPMGRDHHELIDALARGDGDTAEEVARRHLENSRRLMMDALLGNGAIGRVAIRA